MSSAKVNNSKTEKKRKSRYAYNRRRSRSFGGLITSELCKTIGKEKSPQERLSLLVESSLKNAYNIALREFGLNSIDSERVEDNIKNIHSELRKNDVYSSAFSNDESFSNKKFDDDFITEYNEEMTYWDEEIKEWNELVTTERSTLKDLVKDEASLVKFKGTLDCAKYETMNYTELADEISYNIGNFNYQLDQISSTCTMMNKYTELSHKTAAYLNKEAETHFSVTGEQSPRTLIKQLKKTVK